MADIKISALVELTAPADGDMLPMNDVSEAAEKTKRVLFSTLRKAAMADADGDTKITVDSSADEDKIRFFTGAGGEQLVLEDGLFYPSATNDVTLGGISAKWSILFATYFHVTGAQYATFPTNGVSAYGKIMLGDSNTIAWFYLNTAPPGWKALSTGADSVLGVAGGSAAFNASGGTQAGTWTISGLTAATEASHYHNTDISHTHAPGASQQTSTGFRISDGAPTGNGDSGQTEINIATATATGGSTLASSYGGSAHTHTLSQNAAWRPTASIGKLFQLDTA